MSAPDTANSTIDLKPVGALLSDTFQIPAYQRGYRWTGFEVTKLLVDVWDFIQSNEGRFYCLQPLVVKRLPNGAFEVVDGQQRLTTLHIILSCLRPVAPGLIPALFCLTYETRGDAGRPPLDPIDLSRKMENIDYHHICEAWSAVQKWCESHTPPQQLKLLQHLLNDDEAGRNVKVIWFELGGNDNVVDAFTRLNVGKIRLTNDELIRALFLGRGRQGQDADDAIKLQIAYEWDLIEKELQAADFWAFLTDEKREQNRIGFLFDLVAAAHGFSPQQERDEYGVFHHFSERLGVASVREEWLKIKQEYMRLQEWFEDESRVAYHIIGFLVTQEVGLAKIRELSQDCAKSKFDRKLRDRVYQCVMGPLSVPPEQELRDKLTAHLESLEYGADTWRIRRILLLFNIATLLENEESNMRFQFAAFKDNGRKRGWDLEHIRSVASDKINDSAAWLKDCLCVLETIDDDRARERVSAIEDYLAPPSIEPTEEQFETLRASILEYFGESGGQEERNDIANLTLLDSSTNRSYQNAPFAVKRRTILSLDKAGVFAPLCTRNVFLKAYSERPGNSIFWTDEDEEAYRDAILETLVRFFLGKETAQ